MRNAMRDFFYRKDRKEAKALPREETKKKLSLNAL